MAPESELLTSREAEDFTGLRYGYFEHIRRMVAFVEARYPGDEAARDRWAKGAPPWVKVGNRFMYRRADLAPFVTNRAGSNRNGRCRDCDFYRHQSWGIDSQWFDPERAYCTWGQALDVPKSAPTWVLSVTQNHRVVGKGGRACPAFTPRAKGTAPA